MSIVWLILPQNGAISITFIINGAKECNFYWIMFFMEPEEIAISIS